MKYIALCLLISVSAFATPSENPGGDLVYRLEESIDSPPITNEAASQLVMSGVRQIVHGTPIENFETEISERNRLNEEVTRLTTEVRETIARSIQGREHRRTEILARIDQSYHDLLERMAEMARVRAFEEAQRIESERLAQWIPLIKHSFEAITPNLIRRYNPEAVDEIRNQIDSWKGSNLNDHQRATLDLIDRYGSEVGRLAEVVDQTHDGAYRAAHYAVVGAGFDALQDLSAYAVQGGDDYHQTFDAATALLDIAMSMTPGVSLVKDLGEFITGCNAITGENLTTMERALSAVGVITLGTSNIAKGGVKALGLIAKSAKAAGVAQRGIKGAVKAAGRIVDSAGRNWKSVGALLHTVKGNLQKATDGIFKLKNGMHTEKGFEHFLKMSKNSGKEHTIRAVEHFAEDNLTTSILKQKLPNGVTRLQLPKEAWVNTKTYGRAVGESQDGLIKGAKTLFPEHFTPADIAEAAETVLAQNPGSVERALNGVFRGIKVRVLRNPESGKIKSVFPRWTQE